MEVEFRINGVIKSLDVAANESLLAALRREGYYSVRHGCETGECGACTVLIDGTPRPACVTFATQVGGCTLTTLDGLGSSHALHPLQQAFIDSDAVGCGFCTPGMLLSAYALLDHTHDPSEEDVRDALSGNLCRCTGYVKPVQAVLRAAAVMRGEAVDTVETGQAIAVVKLVTNKSVFTDDIELRGMLHARLLTSPHAHAVIRAIDVSRARALPGVYAVLTYRDISRVPYANSSSSLPGTAPRDQYCLDYIVRYVGDRVAAVAASTPEIAEQALRLIQVQYEILPALLDPRKSIEPGAPHIHPETESSGIYDASRNRAAHIQADVGAIERGFVEADYVIEADYVVPQTQQAAIETRTAITYFDEDDRLVVRTNAPSAHAVQHIIAPLIGLSPHRIHVVAPRSGGAATAGMLVEDICALLTLATHQPVRMEYSRAEEFRSSPSYPQQFIHLKTGVRRDGMLVANHMTLLANTGAYGSLAPKMLRAAALNALPLYPCLNMRYTADAVYTNLPPAENSDNDAIGAVFALESHMDEIAKQVGIDPFALRRRNWLKAGEEHRLAKALGENAAHSVTDGERPYRIERCGLPQCLQIVEEKLGWQERRGRATTGRYRRGIGIALSMQHAADEISKSGASVKLNEDGSFTVLIGASTAAETHIAHIAAEALGVRIEDIIVRSSDTDITPFESGVNAASSDSAAARAVKEAAEQARAQLLGVAGRMLKADPRSLTLEHRLITALNGDTLTITQVASHCLYAANESPIMTVAVETTAKAVSAFAAHAAEVEVDTETGVVRILRAVSALDAGHIINPLIAESQVEGEIARALGQSISEEMFYNQQGAPLTTSLSDYRIYSAPDMPHMEIYFVEPPDQSDSFGTQSLSALCTGSMAAAIANAVVDALGVRVSQIPLTPERVLRAIRSQGTK